MVATAGGRWWWWWYWAEGGGGRAEVRLRGGGEQQQASRQGGQGGPGCRRLERGRGGEDGELDGSWVVCVVCNRGGSALVV